MPPQPNESFTPTQTTAACPWYQPLCKVTPVSKYLAMIIFIVMPFIGAYVGYQTGMDHQLEIVVVQPQDNVNGKSEVESDTVPAVVHVVVNDNSVDAAILSLTEPASTDFSDGWTQDSDASPRDMIYPDGGSGSVEKYTLSDVGSHANENDCWVVFESGVHDITRLLPLANLFPSITELSAHCGTDITKFIENKPVEKGSLNTARFRYAIAHFFVGGLEK